jgi:hypothetical protein
MSNDFWSTMFDPDRGKNVSETIVRTIHKELLTIMVKNSMNCSTNMENNQSVSIEGVVGLVLENVRLIQKSMINATCESKTENVNVLKTEIKNAIAQKTESTSSGFELFTRANRATALTTINNLIDQNITVDNMFDCSTKGYQSQVLFIKNSMNITIKNLTLEQSYIGYMKAANSLLNNVTKSTYTDTDIDQDAKAASEGFSLDLTTIFIIVGIVVFIILIIAAVVFFTKHPAGKKLAAKIFGKKDESKTIVKPKTVKK